MHHAVKDVMVEGEKAMCLGAAKPAVGHGRMRGHGEGDYGAPGVGELNKSWTRFNVCKVRRKYRLSHFKHSSEIYTNITNESLHVDNRIIGQSLWLFASVLANPMAPWSLN